MIKDKFVQIGTDVFNTAHILSVGLYEDGSVRLHTSHLNSNSPGAPNFYDYDGELAEKIKKFFEANCQKIG